MHYLSDEWITAADAAIQAASATAPSGQVIVDQIVEGACSYRVIIDQGASSITPLDEQASLAPADASFRQTAATAAAVAQGHTDAHQAFLLGQIRFEGDINILIERREALIWLETVLAPVIALSVFTD